MFTKRYRIFDLLGFPIYLDLSWFAIVVLISWSLASGVFPQRVEGLSRTAYWAMGVAGALGLFASILAHELGHAVVARRFGLHHKMFPVTDDEGRILGCVTTRDVQNAPQGEWSTTTVAQISKKCGADNTLPPTSDTMEAISKMSQTGVSRLLVVDGEKLVGLLSLSDLMKFIALKVELEDGKAENRKGAYV